MTRWMPWTLACALGCGTPADDKVDETDTPDSDVAETDAAETDVAETDETGFTPPNWADLGYADRLIYMRDVVMPTLQRIWDEESPRALELECSTCHGNDAPARQYAMPNTLYPLYLPVNAWPSEFGSPEEEAFSLFMRDDVSTTLADLLGQTFNKTMPLSGTTTCFSCHAESDEPPEGD